MSPFSLWSNSVYSYVRCTMGPKKRTFLEMDSSEKKIKEYYLDKKVKKRSNKLETIYEESDNVTDDSTICMSAKRFKRLLKFPDGITNTKLQKRRARIRKLFGSRIRCNRNNVSLRILVDRLNSIRENSSNIDNE